MADQAKQPGQDNYEPAVRIHSALFQQLDIAHTT
jgi:hypothetical protein